MLLLQATSSLAWHWPQHDFAYQKNPVPLNLPLRQRLVATAFKVATIKSVAVIYLTRLGRSRPLSSRACRCGNAG